MNAEHSNAITISAGHNEPCHLCGELCDGLAGNPGKWPIMLPVDGAPKWHHTGCVAARLADQDAEIDHLREALAPFAVGYRTFYCGQPDDRLLSLGHWTEVDGDLLPRFYGDVALSVGDVRHAYQLLHPTEDDS